MLNQKLYRPQRESVCACMCVNQSLWDSPSAATCVRKNAEVMQSSANVRQQYSGTWNSMGTQPEPTTHWCWEGGDGETERRIQNWSHGLTPRQWVPGVTHIGTDDSRSGNQPQPMEGCTSQCTHQYFLIWAQVLGMIIYAHHFLHVLLWLLIYCILIL